MACELSFALTNAAVFWVASVFGSIEAPDLVAMHSTVAILFGVGSVFVFYRLIVAGGLPAIAFYVLGTGLFFGFGTYLSTFVDDYVYVTLFNRSIQEQYLAQINLMNASSILIVLFTAGTLFKKCGPRGHGQAIEDLINNLYRFRLIIFGIAAVVLLLHIITFPTPENLFLRGSLSKIKPIVLLAILLGGYRWRTIQMLEKLCVLGLLGGECLLGLLSLSKTDVMLPIVALVAGLLLERRSRRLASAMGLATVVAYVFVFSPLVANGRYVLNRSDAPDTFEGRVVLLSDLLQGSSEIPTEDEPNTTQVLKRFAAGPFQAFLMREFDEGRPGLQPFGFLGRARASDSVA